MENVRSCLRLYVPVRRLSVFVFFCSLPSTFSFCNGTSRVVYISHCGVQRSVMASLTARSVAFFERERDIMVESYVRVVNSGFEAFLLQ